VAAQRRQLGQILSSRGAVFRTNLKDLHVSPSTMMEASGANPRSAGHEVQPRRWVRTHTMLSQYTYAH